MLHYGPPYPAVPVTLAIRCVGIHTNTPFTSPASITLDAFQEGRLIEFRDMSPAGFSPIRVDVDQRSFNTWFAKASSVEHLAQLLEEHYEAEIAKRRFKLLPFHRENLGYWFVHISAYRQMKGLTANTREHGAVHWTELYPKGTPERRQIHELINRLGRTRQAKRRREAQENKAREASRRFARYSTRL